MTALSYYAELDAMNYVQSRTMGIANIRLPSESVFSFKLDTIFVFGSPWEVSAGGLAMDVGRNISARKALDGDNNKTVQFVLSAGMNSSALEHSVPEQLFSTPENPAEGISAVKALKIANDQGIPIYTINQTNIDSILPQLEVDSDVKSDIVNAVNAEKVVTVSKTNINFNGWTGVGYIIIDPNTGNGAYMISGGLSGGWLVLAFILNMLLSLFVSDADAAEHFSSSEANCMYLHASEYIDCHLEEYLSWPNSLYITVLLLLAFAGITSGTPFGVIGGIIIIIGLIMYFINTSAQCAREATYCDG